MSLLRRVLRKVRNKIVGSPSSPKPDVSPVFDEAAEQLYRAQSQTLWDDGNGTVLGLVTASEHHIPFLMSCNSDVEGLRMIGYTHRVWPDKFMQEMYGWHLFQIITMNDRPVGFIKAYVKIEDRAAFVSMYLIPKIRSQGIAQLVIRPFLTTLFESLSLHKVQFGVWAFNHQSLNNFKSISVEYISRDDTYYQGRYWDKYVFCIMEDGWPKLKQKLEEDEQRAKGILLRRKQRNQKLRVGHSAVNA